MATTTLGWNELVAREPRLGDLMAEVRQERATDPPYCANARFLGYGGHPGYKRRIVALVGWFSDAADPELRTRAAYDTAYQRLYNQMPDCRD